MRYLKNYKSVFESKKVTNEDWIELMYFLVDFLEDWGVVPCTSNEYDGLELDTDEPEYPLHKFWGFLTVDVINGEFIYELISNVDELGGKQINYFKIFNIEEIDEYQDFKEELESLLKEAEKYLNKKLTLGTGTTVIEGAYKQTMYDFEIKIHNDL